VCVLFWFFVFFESRRIPSASSRLGFGAQQTETDPVVVVEVVVLSIVNCLFSREGAGLLFVCLLGFFFSLFGASEIYLSCLFVCLSDSLLLSQSISGLISKSWLRASRCCGTWKYASRLLLFFFNSGHRNSNLESEEVRGGVFVGRRVNGRRCCYCLRLWLQQYVSFMLGTLLLLLFLLLLLLLLPCSPLLRLLAGCKFSNIISGTEFFQVLQQWTILVFFPL